MPLIPKPNYNQIFASQAPDQDKPAVFNNYPLGWGVESRPNNGKPTIKGFNYLQQTSDLKDLWILQNGACLPYDESIEYAEGAPVLKDGVIQYKTAGGFSPAISEKPYILNYFTEGASYPLNARVTLENGDIVKSTVDGNTTDPNEDMAGWTNPELEQLIRNDQIINLVSDFKAVPGTDCTTNIYNAILEAIRTGRPLYIPSTVLPYLYRVREMYFNFVGISDNGCLTIFGDGESSHFKCLDGQIDQNWCQSFRFAPTVNVKSIYIKDIKVDNNARGSTPPPIENPYAYEQSATFALGAVAGSTIDSVTYDNVIVVDPAADSFNNSSRGKIGELRYLNVVERGRTRVRASIQESFSALKTIIANPLVHSIESEAGVAPTNGRATVQINGGQVNILDIGANNENDDVTYRVNNLIVTDFCNIGVLKDLEVNGGQLPISANQSNFPYLTKAIFRNLKILHPYDPVTGAVTSLYFLRRLTSDAKSYVEFDNVTFEIKHEGSLPVAATNPLITNTAGSAIAEAVAANHELVIKNSRFDKRAYQSIAAHRMGKVALINNKYAGAYAAIGWTTAGSGYATDLRIDGGDFNDVTGDALVFSGVVTPAHKLKLAGRWQGVAASKVKLLSGAMAAFAANINNARILELNTALPTIALTNDVFVKSSASNIVGDVVEYQCVAGSVTAPAFVCKNQLGVYAAATADLPILTQNEQLARAHDTTTNTIKTWMGASWV